MNTVFASAAFLLLAYMSCMFIVGLRARDNSLIDIAYGPAFVAATISARCNSGVMPFSKSVRRFSIWDLTRVLYANGNIISVTARQGSATVWCGIIIWC